MAVERAIADRNGWLRAGFDPVRIAVNVSPLQLNQPDFVAQVEAILDETGAPAAQLIFEVTEGLLIAVLYRRDKGAF